MKKEQQQKHQETKAIQYAVRMTDSLNNSILRLCKDTNTKSGEVYYLITAESCDPDKDPINTDPRVINEGAPSLL